MTKWILIFLFILIVVMILPSGCALVVTEKLIYIRFGSQEIENCAGRTDPNGISWFYFTKQRAKVELDPLKIGGLL